jgi:acetolactate synthase-1/2/3 large subunit
MGYAARFAWPAYRPRTFLSPGYQGTLGWGYATAARRQDRQAGHCRSCRSAAMAASCSPRWRWRPRRSTGSASWRSCSATAPIGNVRRIQQQSFNNRTIASELRNPDFVRLGESFGIDAVRAGSPDELGAAVARGIAKGGPLLIDCPVGQLPDPWPLDHRAAQSGRARSSRRRCQFVPAIGWKYLRLAHRRAVSTRQRYHDT